MKFGQLINVAEKYFSLKVMQKMRKEDKFQTSSLFFGKALYKVKARVWRFHLIYFGRPPLASPPYFAYDFFKKNISGIFY